MSKESNETIIIAKKIADQIITRREIIKSAIHDVCVLLIFLALFATLAWIYSPTEFTVNFNMTADDNLVQIVETAENISESQRIEMYYEIDDNETILYHEDGDYQNGWGVLNESLEVAA